MSDETLNQIERFINQKLPKDYPEINFSLKTEYAKGYYAALFDIKMRLSK